MILLYAEVGLGFQMKNPGSVRGEKRGCGRWQWVTASVSERVGHPFRVREGPSPGQNGPRAFRECEIHFRVRPEKRPARPFARNVGTRWSPCRAAVLPRFQSGMGKRRFPARLGGGASIPISPRSPIIPRVSKGRARQGMPGTRESPRGSPRQRALPAPSSTPGPAKAGRRRSRSRGIGAQLNGPATAPRAPPAAPQLLPARPTAPCVMTPAPNAEAARARLVQPRAERGAAAAAGRDAGRGPARAQCSVSPRRAARAGGRSGRSARAAGAGHGAPGPPPGGCGGCFPGPACREGGSPASGARRWNGGQRRRPWRPPAPWGPRSSPARPRPRRSTSWRRK